MRRERWSSRVAFIFASIGAAVGFGNVWRFPSLAYEYGGGAFFIPYLLALFIVGIPLLMLEYGLGQYYQTGDVGAFGTIHERLRGIGLSSVTNGYFVVVYYCTLLVWATRAFFESFNGILEWQNVTGKEAFNYFILNIMEMPTTDTSQWATLTPSRLAWVNVGYLALCWFIIFLCLAWGLKWTGRITYFTMGFPIILLFVFLGRALTLPGSEDGVHAYIGVWDVSVLTERPDVWSTAVTQIFFSLSLTFGIMTAFGSHLERNSPCFFNSVTVAFCNSMFSFIAGFAVFGSLGYIAYETGVPVEDTVAGGPSLVFGTWPVVLATLPGGQHWVRLFFVMLFLLGIDSAFALLEAAVTVTRDTQYFNNSSRKLVVLAWSIFAFLCGLLYCTDTGFLFLDVVDFYINFIMLLVGGFECFSAGWVYGLEKQVETLGWKPVLSYMITTFGSVILASGLWFGLRNIWAGFVGGAGAFIIGLGLTMKLCRPLRPNKTWKTISYDLFLSNAMALKSDLQAVVGWMPYAWALLMKHILPQLLLILFVNLASTKNSSGEPVFGNYGGYISWPYQVLGIFIVCLTCFILLVGMAVPKAYEKMSLPLEELLRDEPTATGAKVPEGDREVDSKHGEEDEDQATHKDHHSGAEDDVENAPVNPPSTGAEGDPVIDPVVV